MHARLSLRQPRLHEIEAAAVEDCRVSEGISEPPRLQSDRGFDLHHFPTFPRASAKRPRRTQAIGKLRCAFSSCRIVTICCRPTSSSQAT